MYKHGFTLVGILAITVSLGILGWYVWSQNKENPPRPGLVKVDGYVYSEPGAVVCQAVLPGCGVCYGEVIEQECWVDPEELSDFEKRVMGV